MDNLIRRILQRGAASIDECCARRLGQQYGRRADLRLLGLRRIFTEWCPPDSMGLMGAAQAATEAKLGDRSPFNAIAVDVAARLDKGDLAGAAKRIKGLEIAWDGAEAGFKPRAAAQWHVPDKKIDAALKALRVKKPDASECRQTLDEVIMMMDQSSVKISNAQAQVLR